MASKQFPPILGMDNRSNDAALEISGKTPALYVRDACNLDIDKTGHVQMRSGMMLKSSTAYSDMWQSSLHGDCFARLGNSWVLVDLNTMTHRVLIEYAGDGPYSHLLLNNKVAMSCAEGLYIFNGQTSQRLTIDTPAAPLVRAAAEQGSLPAGKYSFAVSWLVGEMESGVSALASFNVDNGSVELIFPYCLDAKVSAVRLYMTDHSGSELRQAGEYPIDQSALQLMALPDLGRAASFRHLSPMLSGRFLRLWRGMLLTVQANVLRFSQPMAFHLTDERFDFMQFGQRITFIEPVDSGIWVGQYDHVVFLRGNSASDMVQEFKACANPIAGSSCILQSDMVDSELSQGGSAVALWLAENGFVVGTPAGQIVELQSDHLSGISAVKGTAVGFEGRITALVN